MELVKNIILVKNQCEIQIRHNKNTPMFYGGNTRGGPLHLPALLCCAFNIWYYMLQVFYFLFACVKGPFCLCQLAFLLARLFFTLDAKYPFYICKIQVNAPLYAHHCTQTQAHIPGPMHAMRASKHGGNCQYVSLDCSNHSVTCVRVVFHHQITEVCRTKL